MIWYIKRLLSMNLLEVLWRIRLAVRFLIDWFEAERSKNRKSIHRLIQKRDGENNYPINGHNKGQPVYVINIFNISFDVDTKFDWHKDYYSGKIVERKFSRRIKIREPSVVGDIKYVWEINRHQYLSALAYSCYAEQYKQYIVTSINQWILDNPYLKGVNWTSSLELALRIISWAFIFPTIRDQLLRSTREMQKFSESVYLHLRNISKNLSRYSSANNHLIGEAAGLYVGSICFPWWNDSSSWRQYAKEILEQEILLQISSDGINKEQTTAYHLFTLEFFLLTYLIGRNYGDAFSSQYLERIQAMLVYLNSITTESGDLPWFGDSDDGRAFLLSPFETNLHVTMELGGLLLQDSSLLRLSDGPSCAFRALFKENQLTCISSQKSLPSKNTTRALFKEGGIAILRNSDNTLRMLMDFGDLGYTSLAAHGHADALSIVLAIRDRYFLIDPGTYSYYSHPEWRSYFRSTAAHNTIRIDSQDQSVMGGRFLWTKKANAKLLCWESGDTVDLIEAEHDGYQRLADPVTHKRKVIFDKHESQFNITDTLVCNDEHLVELFFHLHEDSEIRATGKDFAKIFFHEHNVIFKMSREEFQLGILKASESPLAGWRSITFHRKQAINTLRFMGKIKGTTKINTTITIY